MANDLHSALIVLNAGMEGQTFGVRRFLGACRNEPKGFASAQPSSTQDSTQILQIPPPSLVAHVSDRRHIF
jgi:hypothetical protein